MLWWVLMVFGVTVLVLQWMIFRRQFAFILAGLLLIVGGGLGVAGVWQRGTNPLEQAVGAIRRQVPGVIPPSAPADAPVGPLPTPQAPVDPGSSPASPSPASPSPASPEPATPPLSTPGASPASPPSSVAPEPPTNTNPSELPPPQPQIPPSPSPTPPASPDPASPEPASPPPSAVTEPPTTTPLPERYALEVNANATDANVKLTRADGTDIGSKGVPAKFENLEAGTYTLTVESPGTKGFKGSVNVPQSRNLTVYLEK